jgi:hypothetical protein
LRKSGSIRADAPAKALVDAQSLTFRNVSLWETSEKSRSSRVDCPRLQLQMSTIQRHIEDLAGRDAWTYRASRASAAEPAAYAALALAAWNRWDEARQPATWLAKIQRTDGSVGVFATEPEPRWPTSLATLAWAAIDRGDRSHAFAASVECAVRWSLEDRGKAGQKSPQVGHDPSIVGWSWAANTASWLEPTCFHVLALSAIGLENHPRAREGRRLIVDRLLPDGGANYGNTLVLGQKLVPHPAPTGVALVALAGHASDDSRVLQSLDYLEHTLEPGMTPASLAWAIMGLTAHLRRPDSAEAWIEAALADNRWQPHAANELSLLLLAARPDRAWLPMSRPMMQEVVAS